MGSQDGYVELKVLKSRLLHGQEEKARRGELFRIVAPGYKCDEGKIVKDPDLRVQAAIGLVFTKFREIWSARQTHKWFIDNRVSLPVNKRGNGKVRIDWQLPALTFIRSVLHNPIYAGAYAYGQRPGKMALSDGRIVKRTGTLLQIQRVPEALDERHSTALWLPDPAAPGPPAKRAKDGPAPPSTSQGGEGH